MLHRLELPDRAPELLSSLGVGNRDLQQSLHAPGHLGAETGGGHVEIGLENVARTVAARNDVLVRDVSTFQSNLVEWAREVERGSVGGLESRGTRARGKQREFTV